MLTLRQSSLESPRSRPWMWVTPLIAVLLFVAAMAAFMTTLYQQDLALQQETIVRDVEQSRQNLRVRLLTIQDRVAQLARDTGQETVDEPNFLLRGLELLSDFPELTTIGVMDRERYARWVRTTPRTVQPPLHPANVRIEETNVVWAFNVARENQRQMYSKPFVGNDGQWYIELHSPISIRGFFQGTVFAAIPIAHILNTSLPEDLRRRYALTLTDGSGQTLASSASSPATKAKLSFQAALDPPGHDLTLRASLFKSTPEIAQSALAWTVVGLSALILFSFVMLWRNTSLRSRAELRLVAETRFRRAMENSVDIGMRAMDMQGKITYVNPAFCQMTGFDETDLLGKAPPFPFWPEQNHLHHETLERVLLGQASSSRVEIELRRKDGSHFMARIHVAPLIDTRNIHNGWMTTMTDITEARRARQELERTHKRFTRVLEELDAAVSVWGSDQPGNAELLFCNRLHLEWFGTQPTTPQGLRLTQPTGLPVGQLPQDALEWQHPESGDWFEIRHRRVPWVDGRSVVLQVVIDITLRKETEETARIQQERLQFTSRLVTLGELASSLAHELNQPLAAIANYCMGSVTRIKAGKTSLEDLLPILEKSASQAQRAGNVIRRIREFVKHKTPQRALNDLRHILDDTVSFAELEAKNQLTQIRVVMPDELQPVYVDAILLQQVFLNLIKNAMDAMRDTPTREREIDIHVEQDDKQTTVAIADRGSGIPDAIRDRLFESFFTTKADGMGLGLKLCRSIIEYHQGRLWAEPRHGRGTTFWITLPNERPAETKPAEAIDEISTKS